MINTSDLHPLTIALLKKRGIEEKDFEDFLNPSYEKHIKDPFEIYGVGKAVERIITAIRNEEKICVYSDYDCDGIPGGVLLREFFDGIGYPVEMYIPHRHNEGYGVHKHAIDKLKEKKVSLVITVDSGITNIEEVAYAKERGIDFIVTDHHLPIHEDLPAQAGGKGKQIVPNAVAVINSKQDACNYHDKMLCGCAVAWKLSCALLSKLREESNAHEEARSKKQGARKNSNEQLQTNNEEREVFQSVLQTVEKLPLGWEKWMLDLVGISTIADMVPLQKENRALAHFGLKVLRKTKRPGLLHIFNGQRVKPTYLTEDDIAFTIAPRINAASRMGDPIQAHHMLYERHPEKAEHFARDLEMLNTERKAGVKDIISTLQFDHDVYQNDVIVVGDMSWGPGILGLIAQNIIDETGKPTFVWGQGENKNEVKGSCRSLGDVHVVELMARAGHDVFLGWGGHEGAGGFSVSVEKIDKLSDALNEAIKHVEKKEIASQEIEVDSELSFDDIHEVTYKAIEPIAPFGEGNPKPVFAFSNATPYSLRRFGKKNEHLEITYLKQGNSASASTLQRDTVKAIKFFVDKDIEERATKPHTLLAHLEKSYFGFKPELRLRIVDIR